MKTLFKFKHLPLAAFVLGSGLAVATSLTVNEPNVFNANPNESTEAPNWQPLDGQTVNCGTANTRQCKAYRNPSTNAISFTGTGCNIEKDVTARWPLHLQLIISPRIL